MDPDHEISAHNTVILLERLWRKSGERLAARCRGLADEELLWEPVEDSWNLVPDAAHPGGWTYPYDFDPPHPHPVTSIGWRFAHLIGDNEIYMEHAFGPGLRNFPDLPVHGTADEVLADWENSRRPVTDWLTSASDSDLLEPRPSHLGGSTTAGEVMAILLDEQIHQSPCSATFTVDLGPDPGSWHARSRVRLRHKIAITQPPAKPRILRRTGALRAG